jgi:hypothetical protein
MPTRLPDPTNELFFVLISHFHHLVADKIYTHHKNLVAGQHVKIFRGITLNYKNSLTINFDTIKDMVINNRDDFKTVRGDYKITKDHKRLLTVHHR